MLMLLCRYLHQVCTFHLSFTLLGSSLKMVISEHVGVVVVVVLLGL
jgi:hypothetical protein